MKFAAVLAFLFFSVVDVAELTPGKSLEVRSGEEVVDGIDVSTLDDPALSAFMDAEDEKMVGELDLQVASRTLSSNTKGRKRWFAVVRLVPKVFKVARNFYKSFRGTPKKTSRSGKWVTRQYTNPKGTFSDAKKDFFKLKPTDVKPIGGGGYRGKLGKHNIIVRKKSRPTIEIQSKKPNVNLKRKFRYTSGDRSP